MAGMAGKPSTAGSNSAGGASSGGTASTAGSSAMPLGGDSSLGGAAGSPAEAGSPAAAGSSNGGTSNGGTSNQPEGGDGPMAEAGAGGEGGEPGQPQICQFHSDAPGGNPDPDGAGGAGPEYDIMLQTSPFVGQYLVDSVGRTLFVYGNDLPGDCREDNAPKSRCEADCVVSWPIFDAGERILGPGLNDAAFGSIVRADGLHQTTYYGWPLYYYKNDLTLGQMTGQGKGKTWHVAEVQPASIVIMKEGAVKYLADGAGYTLYVSAGDTVGNGNSDPVSNCSGDCLSKFKRFHQKNPSLVPSLEQQDFSVFVAPDGKLQLAFKGQPLYRAVGDDRAGNTTGVATAGFTVAIP
jgi:predicted lipoprotein with Yx(FWY)xxD motif